MEEVTKFFHIVASILLVCIMIGIGFLVVKEFQGAAGASAISLNKEKVEYQLADKLQYDEGRFKGSEVLSAIRKYQRELQVTVITKSSTTVYPGSSLILVNEIGTANWIDPQAYFTSTIMRDVNGNVAKISFKQEDKNAPTTDPITTLVGAKQLIVNALDGEANTSMTWQQLAEVVNGNGTNLQAKRKLVGALGGDARESMDWSQLAALTEKTVSDLKLQIEARDKEFEDNTVHQVQRTLARQRGCNIGFVPKIVIAYPENTSQVCVFQAGVWTGGNVCTLNGDYIENTSNYDVTFYAFEWK